MGLFAFVSFARDATLSSCSALCLFAAVHCAHRVQIGSFEGEYTSPFGKGLFVCQNDDFVQGFMDEHLIFFGNTDPADGHHLEGVFYNAGTGNCATGTFEFERTSWEWKVTLCAEEMVVSFLFLRFVPLNSAPVITNAVSSLMRITWILKDVGWTKTVSLWTFASALLMMMREMMMMKPFKVPFND